MGRNKKKNKSNHKSPETKHEKEERPICQPIQPIRIRSEVTTTNNNNNNNNSVISRKSTNPWKHDPLLTINAPLGWLKDKYVMLVIPKANRPNDASKPFYKMCRAEMIEADANTSNQYGRSPSLSSPRHFRENNVTATLSGHDFRREVMMAVGNMCMDEDNNILKTPSIASSDSSINASPLPVERSVIPSSTNLSLASLPSTPSSPYTFQSPKKSLNLSQPKLDTNQKLIDAYIIQSSLIPNDFLGVASKIHLRPLSQEIASIRTRKENAIILSLAKAVLQNSKICKGECIQIPFKGIPLSFIVDNIYHFNEIDSVDLKDLSSTFQESCKIEGSKSTKENAQD